MFLDLFIDDNFYKKKLPIDIYEMLLLNQSKTVQALGIVLFTS